jgi:single stranded DNA-binding protein
MDLCLITLIGRLGADPELTTTSSGAHKGKRMARFRIAVNREAGRETETDWHQITAFGATAEAVERYARKGTRVQVEGTVHYRKSDKGYFTDILADAVHFYEGRQELPRPPAPEPVPISAVRAKLDAVLGRSSLEEPHPEDVPAPVGDDMPF